MTDKIEPALSAEEWTADEHGYREIRHGKMIVWQRSKPYDPAPMSVGSEDDTPVAVAASSVPALIALANAALPDSDPRKITREWVERLRKWADFAENDTYHPLQLDPDEARAMADALESYLPPGK